MAAAIIPTLFNCKTMTIGVLGLKVTCWRKIIGTLSKTTITFDRVDEAWRKKNVKAVYAIKNSYGDDTYIFYEGQNHGQTSMRYFVKNFESRI